MITDIGIATEIDGRLLAAQALLANSVAGIKGRCSDEEYCAYRKMIGAVLGALIIDGLTPLEEINLSLREDNRNSRE